MPLAGSDIKWYAADAESVGGTPSPLTGNYGGGISGTLLTNANGTIMRNVSGTDLTNLAVDDEWYDYVKVYVKNTNIDDIPLTNTHVMCTPDGVANLDVFAVGWGLTEGSFYVGGGSGTELSGGKEDYTEDTSTSTPEDSPYPRISPDSDNINYLNSLYGGSTYGYSISYNSIESFKTSYDVSSFNLYLKTNYAINDSCYVKVVGIYDNELVVGYIDLRYGWTWSDSEVYAKTGRNDTGTNQLFEYILCCSVHTPDYYDGGSYNVTDDPSAGREGDITPIYTTSGSGQTSSVVIWITSGSGVSTIGEMYTTDPLVGKGQCFATCFFPETAIGSLSTAINLPTLDPNPSAGELNECYDLKTDCQALWIRRNISKTASSATNITNRFYVFGDSE